MSTDLLSQLIDEMVALLEPLATAADDPWVLDSLLLTLDAGDPRLTGGLVDGLRSLGQGIAELKTLQASSGASLQSAGTALDALRDLTAAARALGQADASAYPALGADLVNLMVLTRLRLASPLVYQLAAMLGVAEYQVLPAIRIDGELVRYPQPVERLAFDRIGTLFTDPLALIREQLPSPPLATVASAEQTADIVVNRIGGVLDALGIPWMYTYPPSDERFLGESAEQAGHTLVIYLPSAIAGDDVPAGVCINLSSAEADDLGVVLTPFGGLTLQGTLGRWTVGLELTADVQALAFGGGQDVRVLATAAATTVHAVASAALPPAAAGTPATVIGAADGTRIELGAPNLSATLDAAQTGIKVELSADAGKSALVVHPGDGDGFLASLLPADGLRAEFQLGLAWSNEHGFSFRGAAGLDATLPVHISVGGVSVPTLHLGLLASDAGLLAEVSASVEVSIGPVHAVVDRVGLTTVVTFPEAAGNLGVADLALGFKPPSGVGLKVDSAAVTGGGFLFHDPEHGQYAGEVHLQFEGIAVRATGLLTTRLPDGKPGFSLLVIVSAEFPPLQLGLGFMLVGVGGLLGINRTVAVEALRAGLKTGALGAVLSPPDPKVSAGQIVAGLAGLFPPAAGRHVFGPTARIVWGAPTLITIELALALELPAPVRLVVLGRLRAVLPDEHEVVVRIQVDMLGVIDFDRGEAAVDATLVDSRLAQFALTGDMALRMSWGAAPTFLLAVGGFHPRFAAPRGFPALERVAVALAAGDNPKLRLEAYLALTSNTVQFGARVDLGARAGSFSIAGFLSFDALVTLAPLAFVVDIAAKLAVKAGGHTILSVSLDLTLSGPRPWRARGRASFSILFFDVSFGFDVTIGDDAAPVLPAPVDVAALLLAAFTDARSWHAQLPAGGAALVTLRAVDPGTEVLAHPLATLQVRQRVAPLERTLDRFGTTVPSGARRFKITLATIGGVRTTLTGLQDRFAPAQFAALSDDDKLSAPSFEDMPSGAALGADDYATGAPASLAVVYEQLLVTAPGVPEPKSQRVSIPGDVFVTLTAGPPARARAFALREGP